MIKRVLVVFLILVAAKPLTYAQDKKTTAEEYIQTYKDLAISEMKRTGIPASVTLAQGLLESGNGNSKLAREANNHFGIKCKSGWSGKSIKIDDDELQECFRAYDKAEDSYKDHSDFLTGNSRYGFLFKLEATDYKSWAYGLKQAGYATNPQYPDIIIGAIDKYALYQYDSGNTRIPPKALADKTEEPKKNIFGKPAPEVSHIKYNEIPAYVIKAGDTYGTIADAHNMMRWEVRKYNDLKVDEPLKPGTIIYLKPKRRKAKEEFHDVREGEGMYFISQYHGIKLRLLYKWNRMEKGQEPATGEKLYLRHKRPAPPLLKPQGTVYDRIGVVAVKPAPPKDSTAEKEPAKKEVPKKDSITATKLVPKDNSGVDSVGRFHTVQDEETMYGISKIYNVRFQDLMEWNHVSGPLKKGQKIYITRPTTYQPKTKTAPLKTDTTTHYTVKQGETLGSISRKVHIPADSIIKLNGLKNFSLKPGQVLLIRPDAKAEKTVENPESNTAEKTETHTVATGETLYSIARKHNMTVQQVIHMNGLSGNSISIGQVLKVKK